MGCSAPAPSSARPGSTCLQLCQGRGQAAEGAADGDERPQGDLDDPRAEQIHSHRCRLWWPLHWCTALLNLLPLCSTLSGRLQILLAQYLNTYKIPFYSETFRTLYSERSSEHECRLQKIQFRPETKLASTSFGIKQLLY